MGYCKRTTFYAGKPENPILFFRIFIKTTFFPQVRQSLLSIEMYETKLVILDTKEKLFTNELWSKIAILCQKTKSEPCEKKLFTNWLWSKIALFVLEKQKTWMLKRSWSQMDNGT